MTKTWTSRGTPSANQLSEIAALLTSGGVVLLPTDTIYGLHAMAGDERAVARIAEVKGRDEGKPFVVIGASIEQLESLGVAPEPNVREVLAELWPAPLTAILPLRNPIAASRGASSLAVRVPDLAWLRHLLSATGPLASTSANRSGEAPIEEPNQLAHDLQPRIDGVFDAGCLPGKPSTIVDFTGEPRFIREVDSAFSQKVWKSLRKSL